MTSITFSSAPRLASTDLARRARPQGPQPYLLQTQMQEKSEIASLLSSLQKMRHDTAMAIIANMR